MADSPPAGAPASPPRPGALKRALPLVGLALLAWILSRQDGTAMAGALGRVTPAALLTAAAAFTINLGIKSLRWRRLLARQGHPLPVMTAVAAFFAGQFYGQVTLGRLGEFYRAEALMSRGVPAGRALSSCLFDRLLDLALVCSLSALLGAVVLGDGGIAWIAAAGALVLCGGGLGVWLLRRWGSAPVDDATGVLARVRGFAAGLLEGSAELLRPAILLEAAVWTGLAWAAYFAALWLLAAGMGVDSGPVLLTTAACLAALSALLPITVSGLGARELIYAQLLATDGVDAEVAIVLSLLHLAVMSASAVGLGALGLLTQRRIDARLSDASEVR